MEIQNERTECLICKCDISTRRYAITRHVKKHNISFEEYINKYFKLTEGEITNCGFCERLAKPTYFLNHTNMTYQVEYPDGYFCGDIECKKCISLDILGIEYEPKKYEKIGSKPEYLSRLYKIDLSEAKNMKYGKPTQKFKCSLVEFQTKYGLIEGEIRYKKRIEGIIKNHSGNKFPCTLENFINKYGLVLGTDKYNKRCEKISYTSSIDFYIDKYGKSEGENKWKSKFRHIRTSKVSKSINDILDHIGIDYETEKNINGKFVDFYIEKYNMCIEYFGNYWHMNPKMYEHTEYNKRVKKTAGEIWEDDKKRLEIIKSKVDTILIIWESTKIDIAILEKTINQFKDKKTVVYL